MIRKNRIARTLRAALFGCATTCSLASAEVVAVRAGRLVDPKAGTVVPGVVVLVENGRVKAAGSLEPGRRADLIAVKGDPLQDVRVLESVVFVMKEGKVARDAR